MAAYFISDAYVRDRDALAIFRARAAASIARYGGRYLVRGSTIETIEGGWAPQVVIVIEFPDMTTARTWYRSAEYGAALAVRDGAIGRNFILVEGFEGGAN